MRNNESLVICLKAPNIPKSTYYYAVNHPLIRIEDKDKGLRKKIETIIRKHKGYGCSRIKQDLFRRFKLTINRKPLTKLLKSWNLQKLRKIKYPKPSPLARHIKELGAKINLVKRLNNPAPLRANSPSAFSLWIAVKTFSI